MEYENILNLRHANKSYSGKLYSDEKVKEILSLALKSPSSFGTEPWEILVIRNQNEGKELINNLKPLMFKQKVLDNCSHLIFVLYKTQKNFVENANYLVDLRNKEEDKEHSKEEANLQTKGFLNHIHRHEESINSWSRHQTYILLANILNSATNFGVDSTPMEGLNFYLVQEHLKKVTNIDFSLNQLSYAICLGEGVNDFYPRKRFSLNTKVKFY